MIINILLNRLRISLFLFTLFFSHHIASATTVLRLSEKEQSSLADTIVLAKTLDIVSQWNKEHTMIETRISLETIDIIKGVLKKNERFLVFQPGGKIGNQAHIIAGNSLYTKSSTVLLFLINIDKKKNHFIETGIGVGKKDIIMRNNEMFISPKISAGLIFIEKNGSITSPDSIPAVEESYNQFKTRILSYKN